MGYSVIKSIRKLDITELINEGSKLNKNHVEVLIDVADYTNGYEFSNETILKMISDSTIRNLLNGRDLSGEISAEINKNNNLHLINYISADESIKAYNDEEYTYINVNVGVRNNKEYREIYKELRKLGIEDGWVKAPSIEVEDVNRVMNIINIDIKSLEEYIDMDCNISLRKKYSRLMGRLGVYTVEVDRDAAIKWFESVGIQVDESFDVGIELSFGKRDDVYFFGVEKTVNGLDYNMYMSMSEAVDDIKLPDENNIVTIDYANSYMNIK